MKQLEAIHQIRDFKMLQDPFLLEISNVAHVVYSTFVISEVPHVAGFPPGFRRLRLNGAMIPVWGRPLFKVIID